MAPAPAKRRVSYVLPFPSEPVPWLDLPAADVDRLGRVRPLLNPSSRQNHEHTTRSRRPRHRLGVAALALDTSTQLTGRPAPEGILYTAGRDGLLISWDLGLSLRRRTATDNTRLRGRWETLTGWADDTIDEEAEEADERPTLDGDILGDVAASISRRRPSGAREVPFEDEWELDPDVPPPASAFRQCTQTHTDWINDLLLCNYNQTVVSASSDGTVQAWTPHAAGSPDPSIVGIHSDYVRCLASCRTQNWIASGSFDRTIKLWDLSRSQATPDPLITLQPADANSPKCSVYAVAADPFGHAVASGGPERVVRMWDPRSGKRSGKLVGHTDNIRAILLSEDSKYLLTGSADGNIHQALVSSYAALSAHLHTSCRLDRSGIVSRVDVSRLNTDVGDGECVLVCREGDDGAAGGSQGQGQGGVNKLVVADDSLVWTATSSSSVRRWRIPARNKANTTPGATASYKDYDYTSTLERDGRSLAPSALSYEGDEGDDGEGETRHGISYASLVRLQSPIDPYPIRSARDPEVATLYSAASVVSVPALRSPPLLSSTSQHIGSPMRTAPLPNSRGAYINRELAAEAQPLVPMPDAVGTIAGERGLVRALVLNDRVHAVSIDTSGEVAVWDLVRGICVGAIPSDVAAAGTKQSAQEWSPREALELVRERLEGEAVVASWATVDTKSGVLAVHINERSFESEIYADEVGYSGDRRFSDETKFNIGKWVLRNLFLGFIREEVRSRRSRRDSNQSQDTTASVHRASVSSETSSRHRGSSSSDPRRRSASSTVISSSRMVPAVTPAAASTPMGTSPLLTPMIPLPVRAKDLIPLPPIVGSPTIASNDATPMPQPNRRPKTGENGGKEGDYFASRPRHTSIQNGAVTPGTDDFSGWAGPGAQTPNTPTSLMGRLKSFGKKRVLEATTPSLPPTVETPTAQETVPDPATKTPVQQLLSGPLSPPSSSEAPTLGISPHILLLIEEEAEPAFKTVYRGTVGSTGSSGDIHALEEAMPLWLIEYLLLHRMPSTPPQVKLSFVLLPWVDKEHREDQLPELLNTTQSKLTASRSLRVRKLLLHVQEKLDKLDPPPPDIVRPRPEELFEILCNDVVLPLDMSIAAVRQYVWRQSSELTMHYRRNQLGACLLRYETTSSRDWPCVGAMNAHSPDLLLASHPLRPQRCSVRGCSKIVDQLTRRGHSAKMCAGCRENHRSYGEAKRARRKAEKALIIGLADGSLPGPAPKPSEPQKPLLEQYPELLASLTEEERVKQSKKRAARTPSSSVAAIAGPSTIPGWAIDPSLFNPLPRASSALAGALGNGPVDMLHPAAATPSGLELEPPAAPRYCSVKNCKIIILDTLEDYPYKMCRSCRDRYRGYGITKRKKSKASRADHDKELEAKLAREDERRAKDGLLPLAQCPEDLAAYQKSLVDAQAAAPPPHQALAHGKVAVPMPPPDPKFSRASADSNRPALRVCSVSHCHKILLSSYKYKRCETHRQQGRWHGLIKRGWDKVQKGIWAEDGTVLIQPGPIKLNKGKGKDKAAESEDAQDNGLEDADTSLEAEVETVSLKPSEKSKLHKDRAICKKDGCCNFILPESRWRTCSSCKAKASRANNRADSSRNDIQESSLASASPGPSVQNASAAITFPAPPTSGTTSASTLPARPVYSGPQLVPYPGPPQPLGYSPFAPLTGPQPMFFIPVAAPYTAPQSLQYYSLPSAAERATAPDLCSVPPAADEPGAVHSRPDANNSAVSRPAKRRRVSGQRDPGQWIAAISTPKGGVIDFNTPPAIVHSSLDRSAIVVPPEEGSPDALPSPPVPAADVAPLDRDVPKASSAPRRECGSPKCRRTIPAGVGGSRCQRCVTKLKRRHDATKQRYHLEPKKGPQLPHRS
uniref:WD40 repeat-like protein n=1 Tax=Mycena chlorophos TaxID=658473 RepID=A0ABQ0KXG8_MYCCL|nr:predicted protein [Mycena chlorophos]